MTLTIELSPEQEAHLTAIAQREGLDLAALAYKLVTEPIRGSNGENGKHQVRGTTSDKNHFYFTATREEFNRALDDIAAMNQNLPVLPPDAFDRENLYEENF